MKNKLFIRKQPLVFTDLLKSNTVHYPELVWLDLPETRISDKLIVSAWTGTFSVLMGREPLKNIQSRAVPGWSGPSFKQELGLVELQMLLPKEQEGTPLQKGADKAFLASFLDGKMSVCNTHRWPKEMRRWAKKKNEWMRQELLLIESQTNNSLI